MRSKFYSGIVGSLDDSEYASLKTLAGNNIIVCCCILTSVVDETVKPH